MKRKMIADDSPTPLWKFVTDHPLVFGAEVLTKCDEIDLKIFYDLCRASREVVIRSKIKLNNERRNVQKVKSMQELALAWDNYRWGEEDEDDIEMTQERFCWRVARTNNLDFLKWVREVKRCAWDEGTIIQAAIQGNLEMVKYCVENDCPMDEYACANAAFDGHLDVLKYLHEHDCPWDSNTCLYAYDYNQIDCLNYAIEHQCPGWERFDQSHPNFDPDYWDSDENEEDFSEEEEEDFSEAEDESSYATRLKRRLSQFILTFHTWTHRHLRKRERERKIKIIIIIRVARACLNVRATLESIERNIFQHPQKGAAQTFINTIINTKKRSIIHHYS